MGEGNDETSGEGQNLAPVWHEGVWLSWGVATLRKSLEALSTRGLAFLQGHDLGQGWGPCLRTRAQEANGPQLRELLDKIETYEASVSGA